MFLLGLKQTKTVDPKQDSKWQIFVFYFFVNFLQRFHWSCFVSIIHRHWNMHMVRNCGIILFHNLTQILTSTVSW